MGVVLYIQDIQSEYKVTHSEFAEVELIGYVEVGANCTCTYIFPVRIYTFYKTKQQQIFCCCYCKVYKF